MGDFICLTIRWGFESLEFLHYFDYSKGTPVLITWFTQNVFYLTFNTILWLLFQGLGSLAFARGDSLEKINDGDSHRRRHTAVIFGEIGAQVDEDKRKIE